MMTKIGSRLYQCGVAALIALQSIAMAQPVSLSQLRDRLLEDGPKSGWFVQCTTHGGAVISGSGRFIFEPDKRIELRFERPNRYAIIFFKDGTQSRIVGGVEQKSSRHSPVGSLMFSIMSMQESSLDSRFALNLQGSIEQFSMSLIPKKRISRVVRAVEITGADGLVNTIQIETRNSRAISLHLFPNEQPAGATCG